MTTEEIYNALVIIAGGDMDAVEIALRAAPRESGKAPNLEDVVRYLAQVVVMRRAVPRGVPEP